ncbi:hypothetical protein [Nonomuraea jabiensis]|uniref:hypothetical protein n=1 Tax=Nonomuraea jabiensis TaxID=882448 RepID=UPI003F4DF4B4
MKAAGCRRAFADKKSGKNAERPESAACHTFLNERDTLVARRQPRHRSTTTSPNCGSSAKAAAPRTNEQLKISKIW